MKMTNTIVALLLCVALIASAGCTGIGNPCQDPCKRERVLDAEGPRIGGEVEAEGPSLGERLDKIGGKIKRGVKKAFDATMRFNLNRDVFGCDVDNCNKCDSEK